jgi:hypothetical protein
VGTGFGECEGGITEVSVMGEGAVSSVGIWSAGLCFSKADVSTSTARKEKKIREKFFLFKA